MKYKFVMVLTSLQQTNTSTAQLPCNYVFKITYGEGTYTEFSEPRQNVRLKIEINDLLRINA